MPLPAGLQWSGRLDSNQRPLEPHSSALAMLSYAPNGADSKPQRFGVKRAMEPVGSLGAVCAPPFYLGDSGSSA